MKVLIIPEDQELGRYVVSPIVEAMFRDLKIPARIDVLPEPRLRRTGNALDSTVVARIVADNPMIDLFLLIVDCDCDRKNNSSKARQRQAEQADKLLACIALQEVEVWMLALYKEQLDAPFSEVRRHCDPKERWAQSLLHNLCSTSWAPMALATGANVRCAAWQAPGAACEIHAPSCGICKWPSATGTISVRAEC